MSLESLRKLCGSLAGATIEIKWGVDEVYSVGGKMFAVFWVNDGRARTVSFKCGSERFLELTDIPGVVPAPYLARAHWVQVQDPKALRVEDAKALLRDAHRLVLAGLPKKTQVAIICAHAATAPPRRAFNARNRFRNS